MDFIFWLHLSSVFPNQEFQEQQQNQFRNLRQQLFLPHDFEISEVYQPAVHVCHKCAIVENSNPNKAES